MPVAGASSRPRSMKTAAARSSSGIARSGPSPTCLPVLRPFPTSPRRQELRRAPPQDPDSSAPDPAMVVIASSSLSVLRQIHAGVLEGPVMEVVASPISIRPPPDPRRSGRDPPPVPQRLGPQEGQGPRQAAGGLAG
ncbi:hypothetical protein VPH35_070151 [Triticum aestivum]